MQIRELAGVVAGSGGALAGPARGGGLVALEGLFEGALRVAERSGSVARAADWEELAGAGATELMGLPLRANGEYSAATRSALQKFDEEYRGRLPVFEGVRFGPPVDNYDPRVELLRLARVDARVEAMEKAGEFDKALDAFIGIHGLKDKITQAQKEEMKGRLMELARGALLEIDWEKAYMGALTQRIDLSLDGLRAALFSEKLTVRMKPVGSGLAVGDPDLLSFVKAPKWRSAAVAPEKLLSYVEDYRRGAG